MAQNATGLFFIDRLIMTNQTPQFSMKYTGYLLIVLWIVAASCTQTKQASPQNLENIYAWCIVPFDSVKRTPEERIGMLQRLGLNKYAYDWRMKHLPDMAHELTLAREAGIEVISVWVWVDANQDTVGALSDGNTQLF
ncbi:MAG: hypothetical protein AAFV07_09690, partial [Bacteroidota bacterium]